MIEYNIYFFDTLEDAFNYQNIHGGALYISGNDSKTQFEYEIAEYLAEVEEPQGKYVVVDNFIRSVIERECFYKFKD